MRNEQFWVPLYGHIQRKLLEVKVTCSASFWPLVPVI